MTTIIAKIRDLIQDNYQNFTETQEFHTSKVFSLQYSNISAVSLIIYKNGSDTPWDTDNYTYSSLTGKVTIHEVTGEELVAGDLLEFQYNAYSKYSDNELTSYIKSALFYISVEQYKTFLVETGDTLNPVPTELEENLIAIVSTILIKGSIRSYKTPEINIVFEEGVSVENKIKQTIAQFAKSYGAYDYVDPTEADAED